MQLYPPSPEQYQTPANSRLWFITGAGKGLGAALAKQVILSGDHIVALVRNHQDALKIQGLNQNKKNQGAAYALIGDVTNENGLKDAIASLEANNFNIDVLVNNAGYGLLGAAEEISSTELRDIFDVNVFGAFHCIKAVLPYMRTRRKGHIINITSISGMAPWAGTTAYTASKFALEGLGQTLREELVDLSVHVTNVAPGALRTQFGASSLKIAAQKIDDYSGAAHEPQRAYEANGGQETGDPAKAACAIIKITKVPNPPMHLLLGQDALKYLNAEHIRISNEIDKYKDLSLSIAFDKDEI